MPRLARLLPLLLVLPAPSLAGEPDGIALEAAALTLRPGGYRWADDPALPGPVTLVVSVPMQMAFVYRGDTLVGVTTVSTGKPGKTTPIGEYSILQKQPFHRSNLYNNAPMPFMQRLTWGGVALHGGALPGYPASHGCIRIPTPFARALFAVTRLGGQVSVVNATIAFPARRPADTVPVLTPKAGELLNDDTVGAAGGGRRRG